MLYIVKGVTVKYNKCQEELDIHASKFEATGEFTTEQMGGYETVHNWRSKQECSYKCENILLITVEGSEYPSGIINYEDTYGKGCKVIKKAVLVSQ